MFYLALPLILPFALASPTCSRSLSRESTFAVTVLQRQASQALVVPSLTCPLQAHLGLYAAQEAVKLRKKDSHWVCESCGRSFMSQDWIDWHLQERHGGLGAGGRFRPLPEQGACLADYCAVLGCPGLGALSEAEEGAAQQQCQGLLAQCFPEAASLAAEGPGAGGEEDAHTAQRRSFFRQQQARLCSSSYAQRAREWRALDARERAFQWTPARVAGALGTVAVFLALLRVIVMEDIKSPIKGYNERKKERLSKEAAAKAAAEAEAETAAAAAEAAAEAAASDASAEPETEEGGTGAPGLRFRGRK
jgi:hypothetical protein